MTQPLKNQIWSCSSACPSAYDQNKMRKKYKNGEEKSYLIFHPIVRWCSPSREMTWCANIRMRRYFISSHHDHLQNFISSKSMIESKQNKVYEKCQYKDEEVFISSNINLL